MNPFKLDIVATDHQFYSGPAELVNVPTCEGLIGILANHSNIITAVIPGAVEFVAASDNGIQARRIRCVVSGGILKIENNAVLILVETAERAEDIDRNRAMLAEKKAREAMENKLSRQEYAAVMADLSRAVARLKS